MFCSIALAKPGVLQPENVSARAAPPLHQLERDPPAMFDHFGYICCEDEKRAWTIL
jgi:hypothetical protein